MLILNFVVMQALIFEHNNMQYIHAYVKKNTHTLAHLGATHSFSVSLVRHHHENYVISLKKNEQN